MNTTSIARKLVKVKALAVSLMLAGCSGAECGALEGGDEDGNMCEGRLKGELRLSSKFAPAQHEAILRAADDWAEWTHFRVSIAFKIVDSDPDIFPARLPAGVTGQQWSEAGTIQIAEQLSPEKTRAVAQHELGHYFGLGHVNAIEQNMYADGDALITPADVEHFDRLWAARR